MKRSFEDGLYNYFSRHNTKRFKALALTFFTFLSLLILLHYDKIFKDQNLYFYTFSTIVQGYLALVGFLGAVVIYKLQILETDLNNLRDQNRPDMEYFRGVAGKGFSWIESMSESEKIVNDHPEHDGSKAERERVAVRFKRFKELSKEKNIIRRKAVDFSLLSFLNVGFSLVSIMLSKFLVVNDLYILGFILVIVAITISILSMFSAIHIIRIVMGYSFSLTITDNTRILS